jgi:hypothetical protein
MEYDDGPEELWDDAEEFERDELIQDHEDDDGEEDLPTDAFEDWRDDANENA